MIDYDRMGYLMQSIDNSTATPNEKDEYMLLLFKNGNIPKKQYDDYLNKKYQNDILKAGLTIGAIIIVGAVIKKLINN